MPILAGAPSYVGPIAGMVTADDVIDAVRDTLATHLAPVLAVFDPPLPEPVAYTAPTMEAIRHDTAVLPALVVTSPGLVDVLVRDFEGVYTGEWEINVGFLVRSAEGSYDETARDTRRYAAAVRTVLMERGDLGGLAAQTYEFTEMYAEADPSAARTLGEGVVGCVVKVYDVARSGQPFTGADGHGTVTATTVTVEILESGSVLQPAPAGLDPSGYTYGLGPYGTGLYGR